MIEISVPEKYIKNCEPDESTYGKFIKKYKFKEGIKKSLIEKEINETNFKISKLSKYEFLKNYILNEKYQLNDFLNISDNSLRGFIFETIWDIIFKLNIIENYNSLEFYHLNGKIESLHDNELSNEISKLKNIENTYQYLIDNKVQSGNSAGISDITLKYKNKNKYVLISSKFYINEKLITQYDITKLVDVMRNMNSEYEIILLVNDKISLEKKIKQTHKKSLAETIHIIYDKKDLKNFFKRLRFIYTNIDLNDYISQNKPFLYIKYHNLILYNIYKSELNTKLKYKKYIWNSAIENELYISLLYTILTKSAEKHIIICDLETQNKIENLKNIYYGFDFINIKYSRNFQSEKIENENIYFFIKCQNIKEFTGKHKNILFICKEPNTNLPDKILNIKWNIEDILNLKNNIIQYYENIPSYIKELSIKPLYESKYLYKDYLNYPDIYIYTDKYYQINENQDIIEYLFGDKNTLNEKYIFYNRIKNKLFKNIKIRIILSSDEINNFHSNLIKNEYVKKLILLNNINLSISSKINDSDIYILLSKNIEFEEIYLSISNIYNKTKNDIVIFDLSKERIEKYKNKFKEIQYLIMDPDISYKNKI